MNNQMLWNTGKPLWSDLKSTNVNFTLGTSQEMSSLILLLGTPILFSCYVTVGTFARRGLSSTKQRH